LLLATNNNGNTAWHIAADMCKFDVLQEISNLAKNHLTADEIKNKLLLATNSEGNTTQH
jgi:hypothetical protein